MRTLMGFLLKHGYSLLAGLVAVEQIGLPVPAVPGLLAMGALTGMGRFHWLPALLVSTLAAVACDLVWYAFGRRRGRAVLGLLCRISLEPDSCVRRTTLVFERYGARTLLVSKFVPGLSTAAPPMAAVAGVGALRFAAWDAAGSLLWAGTFLLAGSVFRSEIEWAADTVGRLGMGSVILALAGLAGWVLWKLHERRRFLRNLRVARIAPEEVLQRLERGEPVTIVDLRHELQYAADPETLPGAVRMEPGELERRPQKLPLGQEIILYCS